MSSALTHAAGVVDDPGLWLVCWYDETGTEEEYVPKANVQKFVLDLHAQRKRNIRVYKPVPFKLVTTAEVLDG